MVEAAALDGVGPADQQSAVLQPARCFALSFIAWPVQNRSRRAFFDEGVSDIRIGMPIHLGYGRGAGALRRTHSGSLARSREHPTRADAAGFVGGTYHCDAAIAR